MASPVRGIEDGIARLFEKREKPKPVAKKREPEPKKPKFSKSGKVMEHGMAYYLTHPRGK
jgi:hypothetical protein